MSDEECRRAVELTDYFSILPAFRGIYHDIPYDYEDRVNDEVKQPYISSEQAPLSVAKIRHFLRSNGLLEQSPPAQTRRYWPGDKEQQEK